MFENNLKLKIFQDFSPVEYTTGDFGKFYIGDSYIVLRTQVYDRTVQL